MFKSASWMILLLLPTLCLWSPAPSFAADDVPVTLRDQDAKITLSNGIVSVTFNKVDGTIPEMHLRDSPNLAGKGAYFAVANSGGHDGWDMKNAAYKVVRNTPDLVELSFGAPIGGVYFTQHYVLRRGDQGFYVFIQQRHLPEDHTEKFGQTRWSFYLNPALFNYEIVNDQVQRPIPDFTGSESVQDATYRLKDGTVYTKYDYVDYLEGHYAHGITGAGPGSYGVFIVRGSNDYLGAPTRQEITVHSGPIIHQFLQSGHFLPRDIAHPTLPDGWTKLAGPWFVYLDSGDSPQQMWRDTKAQVEKAKAQWPDPWMNDPEYPLHRGEVSGTLRLYDGKWPAANALLVLTAPEPNWQVQILNYIFSTRADAEGHFTMPKVRPGTYTLFAAIPGVTDEFRRDNITVTADGTVKLGDINFNPSEYSARLWQIGYPDLRTTGFKLSDQPRRYGLDKTVPADLTYTIGRSTPSQDWYYAQTKPGDWKVDFDADKNYGGEGVLTIGIAGQTNDPKLEILLNDKSIGNVTTAGNSSATYRSAILGSSYDENKILCFPASLLRQGSNTLTLRLARGSIMYDVVKMEIDDPNLPKQIPPLASPPTQNATAFKFDFGPAATATSATLVTPDTVYNAQTGYGFENATGTAKLFSVALLEGNYRVTLRLGDEKIATDTTIKAEARRLMVQDVRTAPGKFVERSFLVNVRSPQIGASNAVRLKDREKGVRDWDDKLTLEFNGAQPAVRSLGIAPIDDAVTVYLTGDSTVTDQPEEPWSSWGQMLPRFFDAQVAVANHAESGETLSSFRGEKRLDKILSTIKAGDYLFIQFGHNDQKDKAAGAGPFTTYKANLKSFIDGTRAKNALPVLVTPMERRRFEGDKPTPTLADFAAAVRQVGQEENVPVIDLNATSLQFYAALGPEGSKKAFVHYAANTFPGQDKALKDDTHFNSYGGYELARAIVEGIKNQVPALSKYLQDDVAPFDPSRPDPAHSFHLSASTLTTPVKPDEK